MHGVLTYIITDEVFEITATSCFPCLSPLLLCCKHRKHDDKESMLGSFGGEDESPVATTGMTVSQCNQVTLQHTLSTTLPFSEESFVESIDLATYT